MKTLTHFGRAQRLHVECLSNQTELTLSCKIENVDDARQSHEQRLDPKIYCILRGWSLHTHIHTHTGRDIERERQSHMYRGTAASESVNVAIQKAKRQKHLAKEQVASGKPMPETASDVANVENPCDSLEKVCYVLCFFRFCFYFLSLFILLFFLSMCAGESPWKAASKLRQFLYVYMPLVVPVCVRVRLCYKDWARIAIKLNERSFAASCKLPVFLLSLCLALCVPVCWLLAAFSVSVTFFLISCFNVPTTSSTTLTSWLTDRLPTFDATKRSSHCSVECPVTLMLGACPCIGASMCACIFAIASRSTKEQHFEQAHA